MNAANDGHQHRATLAGPPADLQTESVEKGYEMVGPAHTSPGPPLRNRKFVDSPLEREMDSNSRSLERGTRTIGAAPSEV